MNLALDIALRLGFVFFVVPVVVQYIPSWDPMVMVGVAFAVILVLQRGKDSVDRVRRGDWGGTSPTPIQSLGAGQRLGGAGDARPHRD